MRPTDADFREALRGHAGRVADYRQGALNDNEFRPVRLSYGLYYQLDHTSHMQRIKLPGGALVRVQMEAIADIADAYARGVIHVTTRQDVQLHWVGLEDIIPIYERLHAVGITTRGACADSVRNVTGCVHAGLWQGELFDIRPYVMALHEYFLFHPLNLTLPRKFKIAVASCEQDCVQAPVNDIAYFPRLRDGRPGFAVQAGGGLGSQPFLAQPISDFIPAEDTLVMAEAIVRLQHRGGERKNRKKARMKYLFQRMGGEHFVAEVLRLYEEIGAQEGEGIRAELREIVDGYRSPAPRHAGAPAATGADEAYAHWVRTNIWAQKQSGYFAAIVHLPLGDVTAAQFRAIGCLADTLGAGEVRTMNDQNLVVPWLPGSRLVEAYRALQDIKLAESDALHITDVTSCPGADYCSLAVSRSMGMAADIRAHLRNANGSVEELGVFRIKISGCPNACGQHHVADIGLTGLSLRGADGEERVHYSILVGGSAGEHEASLGRRLSGRFPAEDVPRVVAALAEFYRTERQPGELFRSFVTRVGIDSLTATARATTSAVH